MRNASFFFLFIAMMLSAQAQAFDEGGLAYTITSSTSPFTVEVTGRASGNTDTEIVIPDTVTNSGTTYSVTTIGYAAFNRNCLVSVTIPDSVTTIGGYAFNESCLTSVTIPDSVESIATGAFFYNNLTSVTIPDSVTTIGEYAFFYNDLTSVTFLGNFGTFELNMFEGNSNLTAITYDPRKSDWPQTFRPAGSGNVAAISGAFELGDLAYLITSANTVEVTGRALGNTDTEIVIPDTVTNSGTTYSVTTIGTSAFAGNALTSVTIGNSVTTIESFAFDSNALTSVTIGNSVTTIGAAAFRQNALTSVTFLGNFGTFNLNMFEGNSILTAITYVQGKLGWPKTFTPAGSDSVAAIPSTFELGDLAYLITSANTVTVTRQASGNSATNINIPDTVTNDGTTYSVTTIGAEAFLFKPLNSVTIPNSVTTIGDYAFASTGITSVTIGNSVTTIGDAAFNSNDLTSLTLPDSVTTIEGNAFSNNDLTTVTFLGDRGAFNLNIFYGNSDLILITYVQGKTGWPRTFTLGVSGSVAAIPSTFEQAGLAYVITSANTVTVTGQALGNSATDISIPDTVTNNGTTYSVTTIGNGAFRSNDLNTVTIGNSVTTIGTYAFSSNNLNTVTIGNSVTTIGSFAFYNNDLTSLTIPDSVTDIGTSAFRINALTSLTIPDSVTTIGEFAFYRNALTSLTIPDSVTAIGSDAFNSNDLTTVTFLGNFEAFELNMFDSNSDLTAITYVQGKSGWPKTFSAGSGNVTTTSLPTTPQITYIESDDQKVLIRVSVASNGGSSITRYDAICSDGTNSFAGTSSSTLITVSGLTNGVAYTCTVTATNGVGTSTASSASAAVTPEEMIPSGLPIWLLYEASK